jgi:hypothetical protein
MTPITVVFAERDRTTAEAVARVLEDAQYTLAPLAADGVLLAVISPEGIQDADLLAQVEAAQDQRARVVLAQTAPVLLPPTLDHLTPVDLAGHGRGQALRAAISAATGAAGVPMRALTANKRQQNLRWGLGVGVFLLVLFGFYTWAIAVFDIEAPTEDFERAYTRSAATVNAFAQPFIPRSTDEAINFETTLESREISDELATVVVGTATQAAADGGFTPIPTGQIVAPDELSVVRQTATGGAIIRTTETAQANDTDFDAMAATATQAAQEANALLQDQFATATAAAE